MATVEATRGRRHPAGAPERPGREVAALLTRARELRDAARRVQEDHAAAERSVREALQPLLDDLVAAELGGIPLGRLKDVTEGRLRLAALEAAGYTTVGAVHAAGRHALRAVPGVGQQTADQAVAAAGQLARAAAGTVAVRIDADHPEAPTTGLLVALHRLVAAGPRLRHAVEAAAGAARQLEGLLPRAEPAAHRLRLLFSGRARRAESLASAGELRLLTEELEDARRAELFAQTSVDLLREPAEAVEALVDFEIRSAEYYSLLARFTGGATDTEAAEGFLPGEVAERVRAQRLDDTHLRVSLRGYQEFGARFALAQRRVILGDEMGLGKTVQAVAALAHLAAQGSRHFLVVCPAGVLINWTREVRARSTLRVLPVHGGDRAAAFEDWRERGGVAVTTFDTLHLLPEFAEPSGPSGPPGPSGSSGPSGFSGPVAGSPAVGTVPAMLVVDEAHYVKNPEARRSRAVAAWAGRSERVLLLTGTPMENRVSEFASLVRLLGPGPAEAAARHGSAAGSVSFRRAVAPCYLRRNQEDVLAELPALVRTDDWEEFSAADRGAYNEAVASGNFMAMRRAAYVDTAESVKLERLRELVGEAADSGLKVVVFSFFREVLASVQQALDPEVLFGPLSGDVSAAGRQRLVDDFSAAQGHAVLLSQIQAGGVGLNLQAASVVVLCEPQVKPTMEHQAVARAHRMGQVRAVQVHRLLATRSVDERMLEILQDKDRLFDAYARRSDVAESLPDAVDISDPSLARRIVEEEQRRLAEEPEPPSAPPSAPAPAPASSSEPVPGPGPEPTSDPAVDPLRSRPPGDRCVALLDSVRDEG